MLFLKSEVMSDLTQFQVEENDVKTTNQQESSENDVEKPSECKIAKTEQEEVQPPGETVEVKVIYNKNKYDVSATSNTTIATFKKQLQELLGEIYAKIIDSFSYSVVFLGVPDSMQKLMYKGLLQDNQTFKTAGVTKGAKIMLVGSTLNDVLAVSSVSKQVSDRFVFRLLCIILFIFFRMWRKWKKRPQQRSLCVNKNYIGKC